MAPTAKRAAKTITTKTRCKPLTNPVCSAFFIEFVFLSFHYFAFLRCKSTSTPPAITAVKARAMPAVLSLVAGISGSSAEAPVPSFCSGWVPCSVSSCWPAKSGFCVASACSVSACVWSDESGAFGLAASGCDGACSVSSPAGFCESSAKSSSRQSYVP